jgi:hypothetical protein
MLIASSEKLSQKQCGGTALPARSVVSFPPPPALVCIGAHSNKHDFTECDMGGGRRTPLIRQGPQYYLRTLPSKPYYICSTVRGDVAFWWNESIANFGANEICSVNYLYDTVFGTGAGARTYFVDGTAAQAWNKTMFAYCLNCVNPESPTFNNDPTISLYSRIDMYYLQAKQTIFFLINQIEHLIYQKNIL